MRRKLVIVFSDFGVLKGSIFIVLKMVASVLKILSRMLKFKVGCINLFTEKIIQLTDLMVINYIYLKFRDSYDKYNEGNVEEIDEPVKIIWTVWLQGIDASTPKVITDAVNSMKYWGGKSGYILNVVTWENFNQFIVLSDEVLESYRSGNIKSAHLTDLIRMKLLSKYGGVWFDGTQFLTNYIPDDIWNPELLFWNKVKDYGPNGMALQAIPFTRCFNNGFLVAKRNAYFYKFASEITEKVILDSITELDYFAVFKSYFAAFERISWLAKLIQKMPVVNPDGLAVRQLWNQPIDNRLVEEIPNNFFFTLNWKKDWKIEIQGVPTVQEYIVNRKG